jgi:RimJ/RimL family protein N-acetyltransferase
MQSYTYKKLTSEHAAPWRILRNEGVASFPMGFLVTPEEAQSADLDRCRDILSSENYRGIFLDHQLVGFCGYHRQTLSRVRHRAEVGPFYVISAYQGQGAATAMMQGVIEEAKQDGLAQLELFVDTKNARALAFYERQGFVQHAVYQDSVRIDGHSRDDYFMVLRL